MSNQSWDSGGSFGDGGALMRPLTSQIGAAASAQASATAARCGDASATALSMAAARSRNLWARARAVAAELAEEMSDLAADDAVSNATPPAPGSPAMATQSLASFAGLAGKPELSEEPIVVIPHYG